MLLLWWTLLSTCLTPSAGDFLHRESGENVTLLCSFENDFGDIDRITGLYLHHRLRWEEEVLYYYPATDKFTPRKGYQRRIHREGSLKNFTITIRNLTVEDSGSYQCVYKQSNKAVNRNVYILVVTGEAQRSTSEIKPQCHACDKCPHVPLVWIIAAACSIGIIGIIAITFLVVLISTKVKHWCSRKKPTIIDNTYEVMTKCTAAVP
ncbi:uncharacterized protein LOC115048744 [Echeneis naucrates]|uniref:uncharacterized protein LOC115048744 n=1 Tax=Echeneis naucrates TaxID=173247 RepID=UPI0011143FFB|nr:uncharacterized protein LOC115048744 [Echeneis naucrates]